MTAKILPFPDEAERARRKLYAHLFAPRTTRVDMIARALDRQAGREPAGMFGAAA